jgi:hypothetical protein
MATPPNTLRELFFASDRRVGQGLATFADLDAASFDGLETIQDVSADATAMNLIANDPAYEELTRSVNAMVAQSESATAMSEIATSQAAMDKVIQSNTALTEVRAVQSADSTFHQSALFGDALNTLDSAVATSGVGGVSDIASSQTAMSDIASSQTAMSEIASSQTAMSEIASSQTAIDEVTAAPTARNEITANATAMSEVAASQLMMTDVAADATFMSEIASSQTAMSEVSANQAAMDSVIASTTGIAEVQSVSSANSTFYQSNLLGDAMNALDSAVATNGVGGISDIAASQAAMDEVMLSRVARSALLGSDLLGGTVFQDPNASQRFFDEGSTFKVVPGEVNFAFFDVFSNSAVDFQIQFNGSTNQNREEGFRLPLDFDYIQTLTVDTSYTGDQRQGAIFLSIKADNTVLFETDLNHTQTTRTLDTSGLTGIKDLKLVQQFKSAVGDEFDMTFGLI